MASLRPVRLRGLLELSETASTTTERGRALEGIVDETFGRVSGIRVKGRNIAGRFGSEELDRILLIDDCKDLPFRSMLVLVESKNWSKPVGSAEVSWFANKLQVRNLTEGILVAANGITGNAADLSAAHDIIQSSLARGIRILVVTRDDLNQLRTTSDVVALLEDKQVLLGSTRSSISGRI